jgi:hypothetical protein
LEINGHQYDSKAILGVAYKHVAPDGKPLPNDFSGGENTVKKILDRLGFVVKVGHDGAAPGSSGGDWTSDEINDLVSDYFSMLDAEVAGEAYSKTAHRSELKTKVHRSDGSIERKHQNVSAILDESGYRWINGYKPLRNYQDALVDAVFARIDALTPKQSADVAPHPPADADPVNVFVSPPKGKAKKGTTQAAPKLKKGYDYAKRDAANRRLGLAGEEFVERIERQRLIDLNHPKLAAKVDHVSKTKGDGLGYDIESFEADGTRIYIEVKTTCGPIDTAFFLSEGERRVSNTHQDAYRLYRVHHWATSPKIYILKGPLDLVLELEPTAYRARTRVAEK